MKQETLEEAASRLLYNKYPYHPPQDSGYWKDMFIEGAKWQEEDMIEKLEMHILVNEHDWNRNPQAQFRDFIEQFKKQ